MAEGKGSRRLFMRADFAFRSREKDDISDWARRFGQVVDVELSYSNARIAFVSFKSETSVDEALKQHERGGISINGNRIHIQRAVPNITGTIIGQCLCMWCVATCVLLAKHYLPIQLKGTAKHSRFTSLEMRIARSKFGDMSRLGRGKKGGE